MIRKVLFDSVLIKKRGSGPSSKTMPVFVTLQTEGNEIEYVEVALAHNAKILFFVNYPLPLQFYGFLSRASP